MAKGHNEPNRDNDYIEQLHWRSQHRMRGSLAYEPKWKFKIRYKFFETTPSGRVIQFITLCAGAYFFYRFARNFFANPAVELPGKIFFVVLVALITTILFFAIKDASKKKIRFDDPDEDR